MNTLEYIKSLDKIRDNVYLAEDIDEENPVDVYYDSRHWLYYTIDKNNDIRVFELLKSIGEINLYHSYEVLRYVLGKVPKNTKVEAIDVFLHSGFISEINYNDYNLEYNQKIDAVECNGVVIFYVGEINHEVISNVIKIYGDLANLSLVDDYLQASDLCTQEQRELILDALAEHYQRSKKDKYIIDVINRIEDDLNNNEYDTVYEFIKSIYEYNDNTLTLLKNYMEK